MGEDRSPATPDQENQHREEIQERPEGAGQVSIGDIHGDLNTGGGDIVGRDKITQNIINNITNVTNVIRNPAEWQDAIWRFTVTHRWFLLAGVGLVLALLAVYWPLRNLYLIPWLAFVGSAGLLLLTAWNIYQRPTTPPRLGVTLLTGVAFLGILGVYGWRIAFPAEFPPGVFGIAIAELGEGDSYRRTSASREISDEIYQNLCAQIGREFPASDYTDPCDLSAGGGENPRNPIAVQRVGVITGEALARDFGGRIGADIVVWGRVLTTQEGVSVDYEILETLDRAINPEYPLVLPVTNRTTEITFQTGRRLRSADVQVAVTGMARNIALYTLGLQAYLDRRFPDAMRLLQEVERQANDPNGLPVSDEGLAWLYFYLGRSAHNVQMVDQGQEWLLEARELRSDEPAIPHSIALGYGMIGGREAERDRFFAEALQKLTDWLRLNPTGQNRAVAYYNRAEIYWVYQKPDNHRFVGPDYEEALKLDPDFIAAYVSYGRFLTEKGQLQEAEELMDEALVRAEATGANPAWIHLNRADILKNAGRLEEAADAYQQAISAAPEEPTMYYLYARFAEAQGETDAALQAYNQVVEYSFNTAWAYEQLANYWLRRERFDQAVVNFERAVREEPQSALLRAYLGDAYYRAGREGDAFAEYETAIALEEELYYVFDTYAVKLERAGGDENLEKAADLYLDALRVRPLDAFALEGLSRHFSRKGAEEIVVSVEDCLALVRQFDEAAADDRPKTADEAVRCVSSLVDELETE